MNKLTHDANVTGLPELLSLKQLAEYLGVPSTSVYYWRQRGQGPPGFFVGKQLRFRVADVQRWLEEQADPKTAA
jgi:excisionase family DNA binding protein